MNLPNSDSLVLLENASAAVNSIFRSLELQPGDIFIYFSTAYGMVKHTAQWLSQDRGIQVIEVPISLPLISSAESYIEPLKAALGSLSAPQLARVRVVTFSHISSVPAFIEPIADLAAVVKAANPSALVLVDGAHAVGQIPVDIPSLGDIDYYLSNGHKWIFSPKGSCFLWVNPRNISPLRPEPSVISSENDVLAAGGMSFPLRYGYTGTKDFTAYISMGAALDFRSLLGGEERIMSYTSGLAAWAGDHLTELWGTSRLSPPAFEGNMINVVLPTKDFAKATAMQAELLELQGIYMLALQDGPSGIIYTRLSSMIYLEKKDFVRVGKAVREYLEANK